MSRYKCAFKWCHSSKRESPHMAFFSFPARDVERCKQWIENTECPEKFNNLTPMQIRTKTVCPLHFPLSSFMNHLCKRLTRSAVPIRGYVNKEVSLMLDQSLIRAQRLKNDRLEWRNPQLTESCAVTCEENDVFHDPESVVPLPIPVECNSSPNGFLDNTTGTSEADPLDGEYDIHNDTGMQDCNDDSANWKDVERSVITEEQDIATERAKYKLVEALSKHLSGPPLILFRMQILCSGNNNMTDKWAIDQKELALTIYYKSPSFYKYMRDRQGFVLPSDADIQHWINSTHAGSL